MKFALGLSLLMACLGSAIANEPVWLMVGRSALLEAAKPLADKRAREGFLVKTSQGPPAKSLADHPEAKFLLLLGEDELSQASEVPAERCQLYRWRSSQAESFLSDAILGDRDGDGLPEVPVGRIPARSTEELQAVVAKILAYENMPMELADLALPVWAADPNYGGHFSASMACALLRTTFTQRAPLWLEPWFLTGDGSDSLSGLAREQPSVFGKRLGGGACLSAMMGHGDTSHFFAIRDGAAWVTFGPNETEYLPAPSTAPLLIFACDCGNFAKKERSLAENILFQAGGPVAVIAATTESHPLPNYYSAVSVLKHLAEDQDRLGNLWQAAQREAHTARELAVEWFAKRLEGQVGGKLDTAKIRADHVKLYSLFGDPATRLHMRKPLAVNLQAEGPGLWKWSIVKPESAEKLTLEHRLKFPGTRRIASSDENEKRAAFAEASQALRFQPKPVDAWEGRISEPGVWRFSTRVGSEICVGAVEIPSP